MADAGKNICPKCKNNSNGTRLTLAVAVLSLSALAFVASGINDDIDKIDKKFISFDTTIQREVDLADTSLKIEIESMIKRLDINDAFIRDHVAGHP